MNQTESRCLNLAVDIAKASAASNTNRQNADTGKAMGEYIASVYEALCEIVKGEPKE